MADPLCVDITVVITDDYQMVTTTYTLHCHIEDTPFENALIQALETAAEDARHYLKYMKEIEHG